MRTANCPNPVRHTACAVPGCDEGAMNIVKVETVALYKTHEDPPPAGTRFSIEAAVEYSGPRMNEPYAVIGFCDHHASLLGIPAQERR